MHCENCQTEGFERDEMFVDPLLKRFVGPCCVPPQMQVPNSDPQTGLQYGFEVSNVNGVVAFLNYRGFTMSFQRRPEDIRRWWDTRHGIQSGDVPSPTTNTLQ